MATLQQMLTAQTPSAVRARLIQALRGVGFVRHRGRGSGSVGISGLAKASSTIVFEVMASGSAGVDGSIRWSIDGGKTWGGTLSPIPHGDEAYAPFSAIKGAVGVDVSMDGAFVLGDTYTCQTVVPRFPTTAWQPLSVPMTLLDIQSMAVADLGELISAIGRGGFLAYSDGDWLTLLAEQVYCLRRKEASRASMRFRLENTGSSIIARTSGSITVGDDLGHRWILAEDIAIPGGARLDALFSAVAPGVFGNVAHGEIHLETTVSWLSVSSIVDGLVIAGMDDETDAELRVRCSGRWDSLACSMNSNGYASEITTAVPSITRVAVTPSKLRPGHVDVRLADAAGGATDAEIAAAETAILELVPTCITADVAPCEELPIDLSVSASVARGFGASVQTAIADGLARLCAETPIGGHVIGSRRIMSREAIVAMIMSCPGVLDCDVSEPAGDVQMAAGQVPSVGDVTVMTEEV